MSADQGLPPEGQPPDDASASGPNALPPWLRDDAEDEVVPVTPPSPIRPITPPSPPPEPALPPWLQDADEDEQLAPAAPAPDPDDWLSGGDALPDSADSSLTFDEWAAQQQAAARPYDIEEEVPDLSDELTQAAPGTGSLKEAETLPNWFLGMDEISSEELPDWFAEPETAAEQAPGTAAQDDVWTPQLATSPLPDEEELPDLDLWAGGLAESDEFSPTANDNDQSWPASAALAADDDDFPLDVPSSAVTGADDLNANIEGSGFDEPAFEWLPTAETPAPQSDLIEEPDLDEFLASPSVGAAPPLPAAPGMDEQAAQSWLTELEGLVAEVSAMPTEDAPASEPDHPEDDAWLAAFGGAAVAAASVENAEGLFSEEPSFDFMETPEPEAEVLQPERPVAEYGSESEDDLWTAAFGGAAVAAASVENAEALSSEEPSFDFIETPEPDAEALQSERPVAEYGSESEDDLWTAAFGGAAVAVASVENAEAPSSEEPSFDFMETPEPEAEADGLFGGAAPLADLPGANSESVNEDDAWLTSFGAEPPEAIAPGAEDEEDDQPALADMTWLMDMQGSGELTVVEPPAASPATPEDLASLAALFDETGESLPDLADELLAEPDFFGAAEDEDVPTAAETASFAADSGQFGDELDIFAVPPPETLEAEPDFFAQVEADETPAEADIFAAAAQDPWWVAAQEDTEAEAAVSEDLPVGQDETVEPEFDTGWLSDDIFGEAQSDEVAAAVSAEDALPGYDELAVLDDVPEFNEFTVAPMEAVEASDDLDVFSATGPLDLDVLDLFGEEQAPVAAAAQAADELPDWMKSDALPGKDTGERAVEPAADDDQDWLIGLGLAAGRAASGVPGAEERPLTLDADFLAPTEDEWMRKLQTGRLGDDEPSDDEEPETIRAGLTAEQINEVGDIDEYLSLLASPKVGTGDDSIIPAVGTYELDALLNQNIGTGELSDEFDWYDTPPAEPEPATAASAYDPYSGAQPFFREDSPELGAARETPEWLSDVTVTSVSAGAIVRQQKDRPEGELDERLQKLRRRSSQAEPATEAVDLTAIAPDFSAERAVPRGEPGTLSLTPEQNNQAALLVTLVGATTGAAARSAGTPAPKREQDVRKWGERAERWLIFAVLAVVVLLPFLVKDLRIGNLPPSEFAAGSPAAAAFEIVNALPPRALVLVGVDYSLGASAELDVMTDGLLRHLLLRNTYPVLISGNAATLARMQTLFDTMSADAAFVSRLNLSGPLVNGRDYFLANFLPGGALGLRAFSQNTAELLLPAVRAALPNVYVNGLDDFKLIAVLSDRAEDVRAYAEQVAPLAAAPVIAGVSYSAAPLVEPYYAAGSLAGLWVGFRDGVTYSLLTGGVLSAAANDSAQPPVLEAAPRDTGPAAPLTQLTATFTPSPTSTVTQTPTPTLTPTPSPTPVPQQAVVPGTQGINLREGPSTAATIVQVLPPGTTLTVIGFNDDRTWAQVSLADGVTGWVSADLIRIQTGGAAGPSAASFGKRSVLRNQELTPAPINTRRPTVTAQATASPTTALTATPRATRTPQPTATNTATPSRTPTVTPSPTVTFTPSATLTPTATPTATPFLVGGGSALNLPPHTPGYRDERWYAMTLGIVASVLIIGAGALLNLIRSLRRRR